MMNNTVNRDRGRSKLQLAFESMLLQNISALEEYLEYYDAALECGSLTRIQDTMGQVKELAEFLTSRARKKQQKQRQTFKPAGIRGGEMGESRDQGGPVPTYLIPPALSTEKTVVDNKSDSVQRQNAPAEGPSKGEGITVNDGDGDDDVNDGDNEDDDDDPELPTWAKADESEKVDDKVADDGFGEEKVNNVEDHDDLDSMLSAIDDKRLQLERRAVEKERASTTPRLQQQATVAAALMKNLEDLTIASKKSPSSSASATNVHTSANGLHLDKPMDTLDLQALSTALPTMATISDISPSSAFRLDSNFAMVRYDDHDAIDELPPNIGSPSAVDDMISPSTSGKNGKSNSFDRESPIPALFMTGNNGEALEFDPTSDNKPLWISGPDWQQKHLTMPHRSQPMKTGFDHTFEEIRKTPRRAAPPPPKQLGHFASPTNASKQKVRPKHAIKFTSAEGESYEAI